MPMKKNLQEDTVISKIKADSDNKTPTKTPIQKIRTNPTV